MHDPTRTPVLVGILLAFSWSLAACESSPTASEDPMEDQIDAIRNATEGFRSSAAAEMAGYALFGPCFEEPGVGAQGFHFSNDALIGDPAIEALRPELLMYEPRGDGSFNLVGVEYLVFQAAWHDAGNPDPPSLLGREFHLVPDLLEEPFYALHLWIWRENPLGLFADWNPDVACR